MDELEELDILQDALDGLHGALVDRVKEEVNDSISSIGDINTLINNELELPIDEVLTNTDKIIADIKTIVVDTIGDLTHGNYSLDDDLANEIVKPIIIVEGGGNEVLETVKDVIVSNIVETTENAAAWVRNVFDTLSKDFNAKNMALLAKIADLESIIDKFGKDQAGLYLPEFDPLLLDKSKPKDDTKDGGIFGLPEFTDLFNKGLEIITDGLFPKLDLSSGDISFEDAFGAIVKEIENAEDLPQSIKDVFAPDMPHILLALIGVGLGIPFAVIQAIIPAFLRSTIMRAEQKSMELGRHSIIDPSSIARLELQGFLSASDPTGFYLEEMARNGIAYERLPHLRDLARSFLSLAELIDLRNRGEIEHEAFEQGLMRLGFVDSDFPLIDVLRFPIPPIQDQIRFVVRDVYDPQIVEEGGLDKNIPEQFIENAALVGISEYWAKLYWMSHFMLPSLGQAFEMYQRGVIQDKNVLRNLMKAQDIAPNWMEPLIEIAYNPITRVDIRRLYQDGLFGIEIPEDLDELTLLVQQSDPIATKAAVAGMIKAYQNVGYTPDDARRLTLFTARRYSQQGETEARNLSRTTIIKFYKEGLLTKDQATDRLLLLGYNENDAAGFISLATLDLIEQQHKSQIKIVKESVKRGTVSIDEGMILLDEIGIAAKERELIKLELQADLIPEARILSKGELEALYAEKIITIDVLYEGLIEIGYSHQNAIRLMKLQAVEIGLAMRKEIEIIEEDNEEV